jgi:MSHA biogenesis protein MshJ
MQTDDLKTHVKGVIDRIDAMSLRERALIFVTTLVAVYFIAVNLLFVPVNAEKDRLQKQLDQTREENRMMDAQIQSLLAGGAHDADADKRARIAALQQDLRQMDTALAKTTSGLVPPKEMARLVEQMLLKNHGLQVLSVESLPAAPLLDGGSEANPNSAAEPMIYKHGMRIELKGRYLDILRYLKSLEALPWRVFWGEVSLKTEQYPEAHLSLLIYTLSTHEGWIGL